MTKYVKLNFWLMIILWVFWCYLLFFGISPDKYFNIFLFLVTLLFALGLTFSHLFFLFYKKRYKNFTDLGVLYKRGLKWGFFLSFGVVGVAFMDAFRLIHWLNLSLFGILYIGFFIQLRGRR